MPRGERARRRSHRCAPGVDRVLRWALGRAFGMLDALEHRDTRAAYPQVSAAGPGHLRGGAGAPERPSSAAWASCRRAEGGPPGLFSTFWLPTPPCWTSDGPRGGKNCGIYGLVLYSLIIVLEAFSLKHVGCLEAFQIFFWPRPDFKIAGTHSIKRCRTMAHARATGGIRSGG